MARKRSLGSFALLVAIGFSIMALLLIPQLSIFMFTSLVVTAALSAMVLWSFEKYSPFMCGSLVVALVLFGYLIELPDVEPPMIPFYLLGGLLGLLAMMHLNLPPYLKIVIACALCLSALFIGTALQPVIRGKGLTAIEVIRYAWVTQWRQMLAVLFGSLLGTYISKRDSART